MHRKFETKMPKQTWVTLLKPCRLQSPETKKSNMATRQPYKQVLGYGSLELIYKVKLKLESGNQSIQYACQAAIFKLTSLKIHRLLPIYISIVPLKFGVDIHSQTKVKESGNQNIQYACPAAILKVTSLKINRLLPMTTMNMYMKF